MKKTLFAFGLAVAFSGSALAADPKYDAFMGRVVGNQTTVSFAGNGTPLVTSSAGLGTPAIGNMGLSQSGTGVILGGNVKVPVAGTSKTADSIARAPITRKAFLAGLGAVASNPFVALGLAVAAPAIVEWLDSGGVGINPNPADYPNNPFIIKRASDGYGFGDVIYNSKAGACNAAIAKANADSTQYYFVAGGDTPESPENCPVRTLYKSNGTVYSNSGALLIEIVENAFPGGYPASLADIEPYMDAPEAPSLTPQVVEQAVTKANIDPFGGQAAKVSLTGPATVPGEKTTTSEPVKLIPGTTTVAPPGTATTDAGTRTTTSQSTTNITYNQNTATTTNTTTSTTNITNNVTNQTINEGDTVTETEENPEIEVCGLPGTPACKIDETGTPEAKEDTADADAKKALKPLDDLIANPQSALPTLPTINWAFTLPSGCAPIALPAFEPWLQEIDVCAFQPMFHDIMTFVWVLGGIFGAIGTFWRNTFSQG